MSLTQKVVAFVTCHEIWLPSVPPLPLEGPTIIGQNERRALVFPEMNELYFEPTKTSVRSTMSNMSLFAQMPIAGVDRVVAYVGRKHNGIVRSLLDSDVSQDNIVYAMCSCYDEHSVEKLFADHEKQTVAWTYVDCLHPRTSTFEYLIHHFLNTGDLFFSKYQMRVS